MTMSKVTITSLLTGLLALILTAESAFGEAVEDSLDFDELALSDDRLSEQRGLADLDLQIQANDSEQNALLQNNTLNSHLTGNNSISGNALSGVTGISTVIQNTGNQVIIQDTTLVNVLINQ